jgi:ABC-type sulfate/molybdate transport systems ATPase subunit
MVSLSKHLSLGISFLNSNKYAIAFECKENEITVIVEDGPEESSLTLRAIAGLALPKYGLITFSGETWLDTNNDVNVAARFRRVGMVFNNYTLFPHMTVIENILFSVPKSNCNSTIPLARKIISKMGIQGIEKLTPSQLSKLDQQKVAFARAFVRKPSVLLFESTAGYDELNLTLKAHEYLRFCRDGLNVPVVFATKDKDTALEVADRIVLL